MWSIFVWPKVITLCGFTLLTKVPFIYFSIFVSFFFLLWRLTWKQQLRHHLHTQSHIHIMGQSYHRSMPSFYVHAQLFCAYVLGLYFTGARLFAQKLHIERWWNWPHVYRSLSHKKSEKLLRREDRLWGEILWAFWCETNLTITKWPASWLFRPLVWSFSITWASKGGGDKGELLPWPAQNRMFLDFLEKLHVFRQKLGSCPLPPLEKKSADAHEHNPICLLHTWHTHWFLP